MPSFMPYVSIGLSFKISSTMVMATSSNLSPSPPSTRTKIKRLTDSPQLFERARNRRRPSKGPKELTFIEREKKRKKKNPHFVWQSISDTLI